MLEQGLLVETATGKPEDDDERRRYYRITKFGNEVARAEARRLTQLVKFARQSSSRQEGVNAAVPVFAAIASCLIPREYGDEMQASLRRPPAAKALRMLWT